MTDRRLTGRVAALMRAGGWRQVTVTAAMGHLGTDVVAVGVDGRRWLLRCHHDPARLTPADVHRFADSARRMRRAEVTMLVLGTDSPSPLLEAAAQAGVTLVDAGSLSWWAAQQR
ncbi:restriction endonuclease [Actinoplanes sp. Pm04-4]|uniref:Restriction endonuclease n=1 Tax=Paractinoplanes pyxinae TaxID=2997416 RepID=A0ABT4BB21_9ACTN|nr:restriction endonuclease [Actinoplanes pyxinae]MCY1143202.1 restriction endonuclease [Actinoplanes pyxinae]